MAALEKKEEQTQGELAQDATAAPPTALASEPLILAAAFLDAAVVVSGVPVMVKQGEFVKFPSGAYLAMYQLCFFLPQAVTTLLAEQLTARYSALVVLAATLAASVVNSAVMASSFSHSALPLFFVSRLLNGLFRHDKMYFGITATALHMPAGQLRRFTQYGMMAGMLASGVAGDVMKDAIAVANLFTCVQVVATALVLLRLRQGNCAVTAVHKFHDYARWLPSLWTAPPAAHHALAMLVAVLMAAAVNQMSYALVGPRFGLSYRFTGAHLCFNLMLQFVGMPYIVARAERLSRTWKTSAVLTGSADAKLMLVAGAAFTVGCATTPFAADRRPLLFYPASVLLVDIPAAILIAKGTPLVKRAFAKPSAEGTKVDLLVVHATQLTKAFAAPLSMCTAEYFHGRPHTILYLSLPLMAYVLAYVRTRNVGVAVAALAVAGFYLVMPSSSSASLEAGDL